MNLCIPILAFTTFTGSCSSSKLNHAIMDNETRTCGIDTATLGAGCFWCTEAIYTELKGVIKVIPGYAGGNVKYPSYEDVCTGTTGHAEVCQVIFDTEKISFEELLEVFWLIHDPTTLNRQGNDVGTQYRSVVFYHSAEQKEQAEEFKKMLNSSGHYAQPVVTEISPLSSFFKAEDYHQNYFSQNKNAPYCQWVISPKVDKFRKVFHDKLKMQETH